MRGYSIIYLLDASQESTDSVSMALDCIASVMSETDELAYYCHGTVVGTSEMSSLLADLSIHGSFIRSSIDSGSGDLASLSERVACVVGMWIGRREPIVDVHTQLDVQHSGYLGHIELGSVDYPIAFFQLIDHLQLVRVDDIDSRQPVKNSYFGAPNTESTADEPLVENYGDFTIRRMTADQAIEHLGRRQYDSEVVALNDDAVLLMAEGNYELARTKLHQALALNPDYPTALVNLGSSYAELFEWRLALPWFEQAYSLDPTFDGLKEARDRCEAKIKYGFDVSDIAQEAQNESEVPFGSVLILESKVEADFACIDPDSIEIDPEAVNTSRLNADVRYETFSTTISAVVKKASGNFRKTCLCPVCRHKFEVLVEQRRVLLLPATALKSDPDWIGEVLRCVRWSLIVPVILQTIAAVTLGIGILYGLNRIEPTLVWPIFGVIWMTCCLIVGGRVVFGFARKARRFERCETDVLLDARLLTRNNVAIPNWARLTYVLRSVQSLPTSKLHRIRTTKDATSATESLGVEQSDINAHYLECDEPAIEKYVTLFAHRNLDLDEVHHELEHVEHPEIKRSIVFTALLALMAFAIEPDFVSRSSTWLSGGGGWLDDNGVYVFLLIAGIVPVFTMLRFLSGHSAWELSFGIGFSVCIWATSTMIDTSTLAGWGDTIYIALIWPSLVVVVALGAVWLRRLFEHSLRVTPSMFRG